MVAKLAYLTIDDAPSDMFISKVDYLRAKGIPALFFCRGERLAARPDDAAYGIKHGYHVGNHSYDHPYFSDLSLAKCYDQIRRTDDWIENVYARAGVKRPGKFFRFPFGDKGGLKYNEAFEPYVGEQAVRKQAIQDFLRGMGYRQPRFENITYAYYRAAGLLEDADCYWTYDVMEWSIFADEHEFGIDGPDKVFARMDEDVPEGCRGLNYAGSSEIILTHDHPESTNLFVPIIERLLAKGITFIAPPLDE